MGRPRRSLPFKEAREIVRAERIESVAQYKKWHDLNKPAGLPRRPDRAYHETFISWNDFLGNENPFPIIRITYRPFNEARAFAQSLNISIRAEWFAMCDAGDLPEDIPRRPDLYYRNKDEWISWGNFLGVTITSRAETVVQTNAIFFIIYNPKAAKDYFRCGMTNGGASSLNDYLRKINGRTVCAYFVPDTFKHESFLTDFNADEHDEYRGYYFIPRNELTPILAKLSINYQKVGN